MGRNVTPSLRNLLEKVPLSKDLKEIQSSQCSYFGKEPSCVGKSPCKGPKAGECLQETARMPEWRNEVGEMGKGPTEGHHQDFWVIIRTSAVSLSKVRVVGI